MNDRRLAPFGALAALTTLGLAGCSGAGIDAADTRTQDLVGGPGVCVQNVQCIATDRFDPVLCRCVPEDAGSACVSREGGPCGGFTENPCACAPGLACVPDRIPDLPGTCEPRRCDPAGRPCPAGEAFDGALCRCVAAECATAGDCSGPLPHICEVCAGGAPACAHWACVAGQCQTALCP